MGTCICISCENKAQVGRHNRPTQWTHCPHQFSSENRCCHEPSLGRQCFVHLIIHVCWLIRCLRFSLSITLIMICALLALFTIQISFGKLIYKDKLMAESCGVFQVLIGFCAKGTWFADLCVHCQLVIARPHCLIALFH